METEKRLTPEFGRRYNFPENVHIEYDGLSGNIVNQVAVKMVVIELGGGRESFMPRCQNKMCCARVTRRWNERTSAVSAWNTRIW